MDSDVRGCCKVLALAVAAICGLIDAGPLAATALTSRTQAWAIAADVVHTLPDGAAFFESWHRAMDVFPRSSNSIPAQAGMTLQSAEAQIIIFAAYNEAAYQHIRRHKLNDPAELDQLRALQAADGQSTVPGLPDGAQVLLTAWWPVAHDRVTAMPVWDAELNPPLRGGNSYITWRRAVGVDCCKSGSEAPIEFAGRSYPLAPRVELGAFRYLTVDSRMAEDLMRDDSKRKAAVIALGRRLEAGDHLVLVALHIAAKRRGDWAWVTLWWHDAPDKGPFAAGRPDSIEGVWRHYLLDAVLEAKVRSTAPGLLTPCFNPWFEARFPHSEGGGGTASNCLACHRRASYPAVSFLPVPAGTPDSRTDPAFAPERVRTDFLWSLARQARSP